MISFSLAEVSLKGSRQRLFDSFNVSGFVRSLRNETRCLIGCEQFANFSKKIKRIRVDVTFALSQASVDNDVCHHFFVLDRPS